MGTHPTRRQPSVREGVLDREFIAASVLGEQPAVYEVVLVADVEEIGRQKRTAFRP